MPQADRVTLEGHLADCRFCRHEVTSARRVLSRLESRRRLWRVAPMAAAAAIALFVFVPRRDTDPSSELMRAPDSADASLGRELIGVLAPQNGTTVAQGPVIFSWRSAGPRLLYRLTVTEAGGSSTRVSNGPVSCSTTRSRSTPSTRSTCRFGSPAKSAST
jgi:hypothetical protein